MVVIFLMVVIMKFQNFQTTFILKFEFLKVEILLFFSAVYLYMIFSSSYIESPGPPPYIYASVWNDHLRDSIKYHCMPNSFLCLYTVSNSLLLLQRTWIWRLRLATMITQSCISLKFFSSPTEVLTIVTALLRVYI